MNSNSRRRNVKIVEYDFNLSNDKSTMKIVCPKTAKVHSTTENCEVTKSVGHPYIRPFDKYLLTGSKQVGKVIYLLIDLGLEVFGVMGSVASTIGNDGNSPWNGKIILYPAWGEGNMDKLRDPENKVSPIHHITCELKGRNKVSCHLTAPNSFTGKKTKIWNAWSSKIKDIDAVQIGTLLFSKPKFLDPSGICERAICFSDHITDNLDQVVRDALNSHHPILSLYGEEPWKSNVLRVDFFITDQVLKDKNYPETSSRQENLTKIPLNEKISLIVRIHNEIETINRQIEWRTKPIE